MFLTFPPLKLKHCNHSKRKKIERNCDYALLTERRLKDEISDIMQKSCLAVSFQDL